LPTSTYEKAYDWLKDFRQVEKNNLLPDLRELGDVLRATAVTRQNDVALWEAVLSGDIGKLDLKEKERQKKIGN